MFKPLEELTYKIDTIGTPQDITVLIPGFAEDGFSDLLTNIIHKELNDFTLEQMNKYGKKPNDTISFYSWSKDIVSWKKVISPCYKYCKNEILLAPKRIVRKNIYLMLDSILKESSLKGKDQRVGGMIAMINLFLNVP